MLPGRLGAAGLQIADQLGHTACERQRQPEHIGVANNWPEVIDRYRLLMVELAAEVYEVAERLGVQPEAFDGVEPALYYPRERRDWDAITRSLDALVERRRRDQKQRSGIWRDIMVRQRHTEVDEQLGQVVRHGAAVGLPLPLTRRLVERIHELEERRATPSWAHLDELDRIRQGALGGDS